MWEPFTVLSGPLRMSCQNQSKYQRDDKRSNVSEPSVLQTDNFLDFVFGFFIFLCAFTCHVGRIVNWMNISCYTERMFSLTIPL